MAAREQRSVRRKSEVHQLPIAAREGPEFERGDLANHDVRLFAKGQVTAIGRKHGTPEIPWGGNPQDVRLA
jgi:hypothetical protein